MCPHAIVCVCVCVCVYNLYMVRSLQRIVECTKTNNSSLEGAMKLKLRHSALLEMPFPMVSFIAEIGFITHSLKFDFGKTGYHMKGHLKRNRMTQISAS